MTESTQTDARVLPNGGSPSVEEAKQVATHLAVGLLRQNQAIADGTAGPVTTLDEHLQWGWDKLALVCLRANVAAPRHLADLVAWLHRPLEDWDALGTLFASVELRGPLLYFGQPSEVCDILGRDMHLAADPDRELDDVPFKEILAHCQAQHLTEAYTAARLFLVKHPYLPVGRIEITSNPEFDDEIRSWLLECYEPVPATSRRQRDGQEVIALCPRCGWPLEWRIADQSAAQCYGELCLRVAPSLQHPQTWQAVSPEAWRTKRGIQASVVGPELALWGLSISLAQEYGLTCRLWPEVDSYDLYVECAGERWAIDMKDVFSPAWLAANVKPFRHLPEWDRAFFLFPDHRRQQAGYLQTFLSRWTRPPLTRAMFVTDFLEMVKGRLEKE